MPDAPSGNLERARIQHVGEIVPGIVIEHPFRKSAWRDAALVGVGVAPDVIKADQQACRRAGLVSRKQAGEAPLLPGGAGIQRQIGEAAAEDCFELRAGSSSRDVDVPMTMES